MPTQFPLAVVLTAVDRLTGPMAKGAGSLAKFGKVASDVGRRMTFGATIPILSLGTAAITTAAGFQRGMNRVQALTGATGDEFDALVDKARELGRSTVFSASEAAGAMGLLAQAGFSPQEILTTTSEVLNLASAAGLELADAAKIAGRVLSGFDRDVSQMAKTIDILAVGANSVNQDIGELSEAFKKAGPVANGLGQSFGATAAALSLLADKGLAGELGGTSLARVLAELATPTTATTKHLNALGISVGDLKGADGELLPMANVLDLLAEKGARAENMMQLFGKRGGPAMIALAASGAEELRALSSKMEDAGGAADRMSRIMLQGAAGASAKVRSAFEGLLISIADSGLLDAFTAMANNLAKVFQRMGMLSPETLRLLTVLGTLLASLGPLLFAFGQMAIGLSGVTTLVAKLWPLLAGLAGFVTSTLVPAVWGFALALAGTGIGAVVLLVGALAAGLAALATTNTKVGKAIRGVWDWVVDGVKSAVGKLAQLAATAVDALPDWLVNLLPGTGAIRAVGALNDAATAPARAFAGNAASEVLDSENLFNLNPSTRFGPGGPPVGPAVAAELVGSTLQAPGGDSNDVETRRTTVRLELPNVPAGASVTTEGESEDFHLDLGPAFGGV